MLGTKPCEAPKVPMPAKGATYLDPSFKTTVVRLTDKAMDAYEGPGIQNEYAKADTENSDGTALILRSMTPLKCSLKMWQKSANVAVLSLMEI